MAWENIVIESVEEIEANNYLAVLLDEMKENARASDTYEKWADSLDKGLNEIEVTFFSTVEQISRFVGVHTLPINIARIFECNCNSDTRRKDLSRIIKEVHELVDEEIQELEECWMTENADILRKTFHRDSPVEAFIKAAIWVADEVSRKTAVSGEKVLGIICRNIGVSAHYVNCGIHLDSMKMMEKIKHNIERQPIKFYLAKQMSWDKMRQPIIR